jgi:putative addiction module component (TIGR02574 family)
MIRIMASTRQRLEDLLKLTREERSELVEALLESLEGGAADQTADAWAAEIMMRIQRNAPGVPAEQVFAEGYARLGDK